MSASARKTWLVCYDIRDPRRLKRVHKTLRRLGATVQYSAFSVLADDIEMREILEGLEQQIDSRVDDIRSYHIPDRSPVWILGTQGAPEGMIIDSATAAKILLAGRFETTQVRKSESDEVEPAA